MNIIIVSPFAEPEKGANTLRVSSLCSFLEKQKCKCEIFSPSRKGIGKSKNVQRYSNIFDLFFRIFFAKSDIVLFSSPPLTHGFVSGIAAIFSGKKFYLDLRDPWPLSYEQMGIYKPGLKLLFYKWLEIRTYSLADKIFVVTDGIQKHVSRKGFVNKTIIAPNGSSGFFSSRKQKSNKKIFVYSGNIENIDFEDMVDSFRSFPDNYYLWILSPVSSSHPIISFAENMIGSRLVFHNISGWSFEKVSSLIAKADIGISVVPENMSYRIVVKTYDYCASGLYCLAKGPSQGSLRNLFLRNPIGKYFSDWKSFSKFKVLPTDISQEARKKRSQIAKEKFDRNQTNKIIYSHLSKD